MSAEQSWGLMGDSVGSITSPSSFCLEYTDGCTGSSTSPPSYCLEYTGLGEGALGELTRARESKGAHGACLCSRPLLQPDLPPAKVYNPSARPGGSNTLAGTELPPIAPEPEAPGRVS